MQVIVQPAHRIDEAFGDGDGGVAEKAEIVFSGEAHLEVAEVSLVFNGHIVGVGDDIVLRLFSVEAVVQNGGERCEGVSLQALLVQPVETFLREVIGGSVDDDRSCEDGVSRVFVDESSLCHKAAVVGEVRVANVEVGTEAHRVAENFHRGGFDGVGLQGTHRCAGGVELRHEDVIFEIHLDVVSSLHLDRDGVEDVGEAECGFGTGVEGETPIDVGLIFLFCKEIIDSHLIEWLLAVFRLDDAGDADDFLR